MSLTAEQQKALTGITELFRPAPKKDPKMAVLTGPAGTGKTFLCSALVKQLDPILSAVTNKAAAVLSESTGLSVRTLAKVLKQRKVNDTTTGQTKFVAPSNIALDKPILFIDEASMLDTNNYEQAKSLAKNHHLLFIGDPFQLPPVGEADAKPFTDPIPKFELTEPQRFGKESGIYATADAIRAAGSGKIVGMKDILSSYEDVEWVNGEKAALKMVEAFKEPGSVDSVRVISFTNARVEQFNYHVKLAVTGDAEVFRPGDILVANEAYEHKGTLLIRNNQTIRVRSVGLSTKLGVPIYDIETTEGVHLPVPVDLPAHRSRIDRLLQEGRRAPYGSAQAKSKFREMFALRDSFADLRLSYAQTVHKSQGSTYSTCFFDLTGLDHQTPLGRRLLYTGVTRAAKRLILFR